MNQYQHILNGGTLTLAPAGWDRLGINYIRNEFYSSISRSLVLSLRFVLKSGGGGLDILAAYETYGIKAAMSYEIKERNPQTNGYETIFSGILDFTPDRFSINYEDMYFEIGAVDGSKEQKFYTRDDIQFDVNSLVSADGTAITDYGFLASVAFPPVNVYLNAYCSHIFNENYTLNNSNNAVTESMGKTGNEITITSNIIGTRIGEVSPIYTNDTAFDVQVTIKTGLTYYIRYGGAPLAINKISTAQLRVRGYDDGGTKIYDNEILSFIYISTPSALDTGYEDDTFLIDVPPNGYVDIELILSTNNTIINPDIDFDVSLNFDHIDLFEESSGQPESSAGCYFVHDALVRLVQLMTSENTPANIMHAPVFAYPDNPYFAYSETGAHRSLAITSGWNLRQFPNKPMNLSMRELFKSIDSMCFLGMGYDRANDRFYVDYKTSFYKDEVMFSLGDVDEFVIEPAKEHYFNEIMYGYGEEVEYEEMQGANEFNVPCVQMLDLPVKSKIDIRTKINGDTMGMELARRLPYMSYPQTDTRYDEQKFIVMASILTFNDTGCRAWTGEYPTTDGFKGVEEYYNTYYTPRENLKRWAKYIAVPLFRSTKESKFIKSQKNVFIEIINESELTGLTPANLSTTPIFYPEYYKIKAPLTRAHISAMNTDPHRKVQFTHDGTIYAGHVIEIKGEGYDKTASWKLLRANSVDNNYLFENGNLFKFENDTQYEFE